MVATESTMLPLGTEAPDFVLPDTEGRMIKRDDFKTSVGLLVMFICNHCPYVIHVREKLVELAARYQPRGISVVGINSNDADNYPEDSPAKMKEYVRKYCYSFPYLYDETQEVAQAYRAACTPDFFLFDGDFKLVYRGQLDDSRPGSSMPVTGADLEAALDALLQGREIEQEQKPSMGCNIKWKV